MLNMFETKCGHWYREKGGKKFCTNTPKSGCVHMGTGYAARLKCSDDYDWGVPAASEQGAIEKYIMIWREAYRYDGLETSGPLWDAIWNSQSDVELSLAKSNFLAQEV